MQIKIELIKVLIAICLILLLIMSYAIYSLNGDVRGLKKEYLILKANKETLYKISVRNQKAVINSDYVAIKENSYFYWIDKGKRDSLGSNKLKNQIVLFVPAKSCNICYDEVYDAMSFAEDSLNISPMIIVNKSNYNEVRNITNDLGLKSMVYYLLDDDIWNIFDIVYAPFLSYIDESLTCRHCFIPYPNYPSFSYSYLKGIKNRYFLKEGE